MNLLTLRVVILGIVAVTCVAGAVALCIFVGGEAAFAVAGSLVSAALIKTIDGIRESRAK